MTDFLLVIVRDLLPQRPDLKVCVSCPQTTSFAHMMTLYKVILMSATLNAESFAAYFATQGVITIPGFTFNVQELWLEDFISSLHLASSSRSGSTNKGKHDRSRSRKQAKMMKDQFRGLDEELLQERYTADKASQHPRATEWYEKLDNAQIARAYKEQLDAAPVS